MRMISIKEDFLDVIPIDSIREAIGVTIVPR